MLVVEDEPYIALADAIRDGLRLEAIAADISAADGDSALELLSIYDAYDEHISPS